MYENSSLDYTPRPASGHHYLGNNSNPKLSGHGYAQLVDGRQSYGDVRKSANVISARRSGSGPGLGGYDDFDTAATSRQHHQPPSVRDRSKGRPHARAASNEVVYDRY